MKSVSVIIPTYNRAHLIARSINSVINQTYKSVTQIIIIDDCSNDDTKMVVASIDDSRIQYERLSENSGACKARNRGVELATGDLVAFQDSDDIWLPEKLEKEVRYLEEQGADMVFHAFSFVDEENGISNQYPADDVKPGVKTLQDLIPYNPASTQTFLFTRECIAHVKFNEDMPRMQDWELALRVSQWGYKICYLNESLTEVNLQRDSISKDDAKGMMGYRVIMNLVAYEYKRRCNELDLQKGKTQLCEEEIIRLNKKIEQLSSERLYYYNLFDEVINSHSWRITAPLRKMSDMLNNLREKHK